MQLSCSLSTRTHIRPVTPPRRDIPPLPRCGQAEAGAVGQGKGGYGHIVTRVVHTVPTPLPRHCPAPACSIPGPRLPPSPLPIRKPLPTPLPPAHPVTCHLGPCPPITLALSAHFSGLPCLSPRPCPLPTPLPVPKPLPSPRPTPRPLPCTPPHRSRRTHRCPPGPGAAPTCLARKPPRSHARACPGVATPPASPLAAREGRFAYVAGRGGVSLLGPRRLGCIADLGTSGASLPDVGVA